MNWFDASGITNLAKSALKEAQKTIDKALDIQDESGEELEYESPPESKSKTSSVTSTPQKDNSDFFASWGLTVSAESAKGDKVKEQSVVTESPSKSSSQSIWGSFAGSFFEQPKSETDSAIVWPPKAKSMNLISDGKYSSQDDLFSKSQLVMYDGAEDIKKDKFIKEEAGVKITERRSSSRSNRLSLISSQNSSDSVEVLSQSLKTTPDSEAASIHTISHSSSCGQKLNSESVEILPDSLVSPSSIECLGFDSYSSDKNSSSPSHLSPSDASDKKITPIGDKTERNETADSVSLVADDDEDTVSYNSVSECTAPTVLDTDEKPVSPFSKPVRLETQRKTLDKEFMHLEPLVAQRMQISENSSNDGSWSDRTLNADNDSVILDPTIEDQKKEVDHEDILIEKLSDSSSFYNINVSSDMLKSESSVFVNVEKQQCNSDSNDSQKDSVKERTSPTSSDSKSDLVKIGSDRTSGHTSGDELETATSSDIEIIPSPNGDNGHSFCRSSPGKYGFKPSKFDGRSSPNLVDLVLGKSLATKIRGHNRELSEASIQSNTSDESQGSENDRLMRRLCEMAEILEAKENRLMEVNRSNAELAENNADLKTQVETLLAKHDTGDISIITEDYTQQMSALEKKFQQVIREKDQLRKQLDILKAESLSRKNSCEIENTMKEKDEIIAQLQEEGEKLARQQLQHSNIIKKLRAKEKENEQVIKSLRDKISEQTAELDRLKRAIAAKEELEVSQIEAVYRLTNANKKLEAELTETKSALDDNMERSETIRTSLEACRRELAEAQRAVTERAQLLAELAPLRAEIESAQAECRRLSALLQQARTDNMQEEQRWALRERALREELSAAREAAAALEAGGGAGAAAESGPAPAALLAQLAALQRAALDRDRAHAAALHALSLQRAEAEASATRATEREAAAREECAALSERLRSAEDERSRLLAQLADAQQQLQRLPKLQEQLDRLQSEVAQAREETSAMRAHVSQLEGQLEEERDALQAERERQGAAQEAAQEVTLGVAQGSWGAGSVVGAEEVVAQLTRRSGELRALGDECARLRAERDSLARTVARLQAASEEARMVREQHDALLQMYGEKEEQLQETRLDLHDVTALYKQQLDELVALRQRLAQASPAGH